MSSSSSISSSSASSGKSSPNSIEEISHFPYFTLSQGQGHIGTRKFVVKGSPAYLERQLSKLCASHWPKRPQSVPVMLQVGAFDEKLKFCRVGDIENNLHFNETLVVVQYQMLFLRTAWPTHIPKPAHPEGSTLSLRVRGSGQFLTMPPSSLRAANAKNEKQVGFSVFENCRIVIPITEYHVTCDRLHPDHVPSNWKRREGTVNCDTFLGERPGTLLFDTWDLDHSFVPAVKEEDGQRYKLTCSLRSRDIPLRAGTGSKEGKDYVGWNYDYHDTQWQHILVATGKKGTAQYREKPRYEEVKFGDLFENGSIATCEMASSSSSSSNSGSSSGSSSS